MSLAKQFTWMIGVSQKLDKKGIGVVSSDSNEKGMYPYLVPGQSVFSVFGFAPVVS